MHEEKLLHFPELKEAYYGLLELPGTIRAMLHSALKWDEQTFDEKISTCMLTRKEKEMVILAIVHAMCKTFKKADSLNS